jgi:hypothetical protein
MTAPSYEQLAALVAAQERTIAQLQARIAEQDAEIAELKRQLAASSRNSSKPPSTDGLDKPAPKSLRGRSGRKPGGQPGREGRTLRQVAVPDEVVVYESDACTGCGGTLTADGPPAGMIRRQVFDIPMITVRVVEHRPVQPAPQPGLGPGHEPPARGGLGDAELRRQVPPGAPGTQHVDDRGEHRPVIDVPGATALRSLAMWRNQRLDDIRCPNHADESAAGSDAAAMASPRPSAARGPARTAHPRAGPNTSTARRGSPAAAADPR